MADQLARQRLRGNVLDQLDRAQRDVRRLERAAVALDDDGALRLPGLLLRVLDAPPAAPAAGYVLVYAASGVDGAVYVRAMDDAGVVKELANWV